MFDEIPMSGHWKTVVKVSKGWSSDIKYSIQTDDNRLLLLRVSDIKLYDVKKKEFEIVSRYSGLGFPMSLTVDFGTCNKGKNVYLLLTWVEGKDLEEVLPGLPDADQYRLGREAGLILKKIHSIELDKSDIPVQSKKEKKLFQLSAYEESSLRIAGDDTVIRFVKENINLIWKQKPVYQHGDYHPGNLIYTKDQSIGVIDFNRWGIGDPYEEFYKLQSFGIERSVLYCIGQIDAYFNDRIPGDFWTALAVYVAHASLYSIKWAEKFGQEDIDGMVRRYHKAFEDYEGFGTVIPKWYTNQLSSGSPNAASRARLTRSGG